MKTLLVLRHSKASHDDDACPDADRPLTGRGKQDANHVGRRLREENLVPDLIVSSSARRARKTAKRVARQSGYEGSLDLRDPLYLAGTAAHVGVLQTLDDRCNRPLVVGHNPGLSEFVHRLTGYEEPLPTSGLAILELPLENWRDLSEETRGKLLALWRPPAE